MKNEL